MTTPSSAPSIDYSSRDYSGIIASVYARASQVVPDWTSRESGDFGVALVDILGYVGDMLSYQIDNVSSETMLVTARRRESVVNIASLMGYRPTGRLAAECTLQFQAPDTSTATVPAGTQVATAPQPDVPTIYFETMSDITFPSGGTIGASQFLTVLAQEGRTIANEQMAISTGEASQYYPLYNMPVIDQSPVIQVQDDPSQPVRTWTYVDNLVEAGGSDEVFSTDTTDAGVTLVAFGNGVTGKIPTRGAQITATYRVGGGVIGNVSAQTVTEFVRTIDNVTSVTNVSPGIGGQDEEDIELIRAKAPYIFAANNRGINDSDWTGLALRVPKVAKALSVSHVYNQPIIYVAPSDGSVASADLLASVVNFIQPRSFAGSVIRAAAATYYYVDVVATVNVEPQYARESVRQIAAQAISNLFAFNNPNGVANFGQTVQQAAVYSALLNIAGVQSVTLAVLAVRGGSGVADLVVPPEQIPQLGTPTIAATGGITPFTPTVEVVGSNPVAPTPSGAPSVSLTRCDPTSTHLEMAWAPGANSTQWYLEVTWLNGSAVVQQGPQLFGPYAVANAIVDVPKRTTVSGTTSIQLRTAAYNGTTGPAYSPVTAVTNPC